MTVVVLYGPKGAGKSRVADALHAEYGVGHVDADALVLNLIAKDVQPHPKDGWLSHVDEAVTNALQDKRTVSVEATGAWDSDWQLADGFKAAGQRVVSVWVFAPLEVTLRRLAQRRTRKAPVTEDEARWIWVSACDRAANRNFDLVLDTGQLAEEDLTRALAPLQTVLSA